MFIFFNQNFQLSHCSGIVEDLVPGNTFAPKGFMTHPNKQGKVNKEFTQNGCELSPSLLHTSDSSMSSPWQLVQLFFVIDP